MLDILLILGVITSTVISIIALIRANKEVKVGDIVKKINDLQLKS